MLPSSGFRREPPVPRLRGEASRRRGNSIFCLEAPWGASFALGFRNPEHLSRFEAACRLLAGCLAASPAIGEGLSPLRPSGGRQFGATLLAGYGVTKPVVVNLRNAFACGVAVPFSHFRQFRAGFTGPEAVPVAPLPAGVEGPPHPRPSAGRRQRATRFAGYARSWPIGAASGFGCLARCRNQVLCTQLACDGLSRPVWPYRFAFPGDRISPFAFMATTCVVSCHVFGATRFAGYGRWHSSRRSLLLGFDLFRGCR